MVILVPLYLVSLFLVKRKEDGIIPFDLLQYWFEWWIGREERGMNDKTDEGERWRERDRSDKKED